MTTGQTDQDALRDQGRAPMPPPLSTSLPARATVSAGSRPTAAAATAAAGPQRPPRSRAWGQLYATLDRDQLPDTALLASLGCGNPTAVADLHVGEIVLDLVSGGGVDVLLSAKRVGPTGKAYGLDMTEEEEEMLALGPRNAAEAGATNVEFVKATSKPSPSPRATSYFKQPGQRCPSRS